MYAPRPLLLVILAVFALGAFALPVVRMLRSAGRTGIVVHRAPHAAHRVVAVALAGYVVAILGWTALCLWMGPEALGVWPAPEALRTLGIALFALAFAMMVAAQSQMGRSWRVGIDPDKTELVTSGLFSVIRNPIYAAMVLAAVGVVLLTPSCWTILGALHAVFVVALQARLEEEHLGRQHGRAYYAYAARVGRFVPRVGRLGPAVMPTDAPDRPSRHPDARRDA
jgi:protein-S-isoprenylcysteine O-methyltransferase Ste14